MAKIKQEIKGNNNIQVAGDFIKTEKVVRKIEVIHNPDEHISDAQAKEIQDRIKKIAYERIGEKESKYKSAYASAYKSLYDRYHTSYFQRVFMMMLLNGLINK